MVRDELDHADAVDFHDTSALGDASLPTNMLIKLMSKLGALSEVHTTVVS